MNKLNRTRRCRRALLAASVLLAVTSCGRHSANGVPSAVSRFPEDLSNAKLEVSGFYMDGWVAESASLNLDQPGGKQALAVRGTVPKIASADFRSDVEVRVDNRTVARQTVGVGDFNIAAPVDAAAGKRRVSVVFSAGQQLPGGDGRMVGARLQFVGFEKPRGDMKTDIASGAGLQLGNGWGALENFKGESFRWVDNDAQIVVAAPYTGYAVVGVLAEAGPGVGGPFWLRVLDGSGRQVDAARVSGRRAVDFSVPVEAGRPNEFRLHVDGGGKRVQSDPRILNFRVFHVESTPGRQD